MIRIENNLVYIKKSGWGFFKLKPGIWQLRLGFIFIEHMPKDWIEVRLQKGSV